MPANMVLLEKITVGSGGASSVTFSSIPQTGYTDLVIKASVRTSGGSPYDFLAVKFNGSSTGYTDKVIYGNGSAAASEQNNSTSYAFGYFIDAGGATANTFGSSEWYIPNYTSSNYKSISQDVVSENNSASQSYTSLAANLWSNTAAITSIAITPVNGATFVQYSTFYLYGVAKLGTTPAIVPYATGGDTIMTDGTYWYHAFKSSGTFTPTKALSCDYLVVAGGGGGAKGGGGGAGGYLTSTGYSCASGTGYTVTIGAGGSGATGTGNGSTGSNSVFATITATGGGYGGWLSVGGNGGSGGGGGYAYAGGSASPSGQGFAGGTGQNGVSASSGGGGGAGAVGANGVANSGGANGGAGLNTLSSWFSTTGTGASGYVAGGGGGSTEAPATYTGGNGGAGGGGDAQGTNHASSAGTANTGGGGGASYSGTMQAGGSGLVIVRYAV